jgi:hypothetical protein
MIAARGGKNKRLAKTQLAKARAIMLGHRRRQWRISTGDELQ